MKFSIQASIAAFLVAMMSTNGVMADACSNQGGVIAMSFDGKGYCLQILNGDCKSQGGVLVNTIKGVLYCVQPFNYVADCKREGGAIFNTIKGIGYCVKPIF
ncbi:hypothetical protein BGZ96_007691 [Linnemannia gamsii]|uniref:Uncharacterized protein n=1 Tax=Linnemannia gamsii TaxID=64522 RepID=A0ABQ7K210_9FUNG|nr:hypothetical protein BGZ96_007691 [Linnemannia gamsii]